MNMLIKRHKEKNWDTHISKSLYFKGEKNADPHKI